MKRSTKYVGLDVHQATTVATVRDASDRVICRSVLTTDAGMLVEFIHSMCGSIHVAFEEGTQAQWLHNLLVPLVDRVVVCDRRGERRLGNKADKADADRISHLLRAGSLRAIYHGGEYLELKELTRAYHNVVEDSTRVKQRLKSLYRARAIRASERSIYSVKHRAEWLSKLPDRGARFRAEMLFAELDVLRTLRPKAKAAMVAEARRHPAWEVLTTIPFFGPVRVATLLATMQTPWRFRTKRNLWAYAGLAVVTQTSAEHHLVGGHIARRQRAPLTRGLNRNHNRALKDVFKGAATTALGRQGALQDLYQGMIDRGMRREMARVTLARKLAAVVLHLWKTGEQYDPTRLSVQGT
jgi:transposase